MQIKILSTGRGLTILIFKKYYIYRECKCISQILIADGCTTDVNGEYFVCLNPTVECQKSHMVSCKPDLIVTCSHIIQYSDRDWIKTSHQTGNR